MAKKLVINYDYPELQEMVDAYYSDKEKIKELRFIQAQREVEIERMFEEANQNVIVLDIGDRLVVLTPDVKLSEKLNKDTLAEEARVLKSDLSKPYDFSYWTAQGNLTPQLIEKCVETEKSFVVKMRKRKKKND